jgi:tetratricopeptide (TPR) repeat protein
MRAPWLLTLALLSALPVRAESPDEAAAEPPGASDAAAEEAADEAEANAEEDEAEEAEVAEDDVTDRPPPPAFEPPPAAAETLQFADHLFLDGDWYRSITEYRRYLFQVRGRGQNAPRAALAIGEALLRGEQWDAAGRQLDGVAQRTSVPRQRWTALFGAGRAYLLDQRPELAKPRLRLLAEDDSVPQNLRDEARWLLAWGHFDAGEMDEAYKYFSELAEAKRAHAEAAAGAAQALLGKDEIETKDPLIAGALSIIPGLGHFYLGRWGIGVTSLAWNGLFLLATIHAWVTGAWGVALVLTLFEIGWYAGGIFGAVAGAIRHNRDAERNWRDEILANYGEGRELPDTFVFEHRTDALPGTLVRFGGSF